ncbi:hypothetical protein [Neobacillus sp. D3-1R]|uniref:hypothetical protein n=1 Tax=Neobacillus sp. D3-1R TaxID=3445778 RepID=UPI003FA12D45
MKKQNKVEIGSWVEFFDKNSNKMVFGFVTSMGRLEAKVYIPEVNEESTVYVMKVVSRDEVELDPQDLQTLIDLALDKRDFSWLDHLVSH